MAMAMMAAIGLAVATAGLGRASDPDFYDLKAAFLKQGTELKFVPVPGIYTDPVARKLVIRKGGRESDVKSLKALSGKVHVDSPQAALPFARLRTSPLSWHAFMVRGAHEEMEVLYR